MNGSETSEYSSVIHITTWSLYFAPSLSAKAIDENTIELTLTDNTNYEASYEIFGDGDTPGNDYMHTVYMPDSGRTVTLIHHPANAGTTYTYTVIVSAKEHDASTYEEANIASATTPGFTPCSRTGEIHQELWLGYPGSQVSSFDFNSQPPSQSRTFTSFETSQNYANNYASRMRGYLCVTQTGFYTFWISSDDQSELWLSPDDDNPANKELIASVIGHTPFRKYDKYPGQQSKQIFLIRGHRYYIEALHKEATGNDFISVGWKLPDGTLERPIAGSHLVPFDVTPVEVCSGAGKIVREIWTGIPGTSVSTIPVNSTPNRTVELTSFATQNYYANEYGSRIRGYVCVPSSGAYTFWIASDDNSELWLSDSDDPSPKRKIASVTGATRELQWDKYVTQRSMPINLLQGKKYYIEVLHKEGGGSDHVAVGWELPSGTLERPIPGNRLIPFENSGNISAASEGLAAMSTMEESNFITLYPNPTLSRQTQLSFSIEDVTDFQGANLQVISTTGEVVLSQRMDCSSDCDDVLLSLDGDVPPGVYVVNVVLKNKRFSKRLYVK